MRSKFYLYWPDSAWVRVYPYREAKFTHEAEICHTNVILLLTQYNVLSSITGVLYNEPSTYRVRYAILKTIAAQGNFKQERTNLCKIR